MLVINSIREVAWEPGPTVQGMLDRNFHCISAKRLHGVDSWSAACSAVGLYLWPIRKPYVSYLLSYPLIRLQLWAKVFFASPLPLWLIQTKSNLITLHSLLAHTVSNTGLWIVLMPLCSQAWKNICLDKLEWFWVKPPCQLATSPANSCARRDYPHALNGTRPDISAPSWLLSEENSGRKIILCPKMDGTAGISKSGDPL